MLFHNVGQWTHKIVLYVHMYCTAVNQHIVFPQLNAEALINFKSPASLFLFFVGDCYSRGVSIVLRELARGESSVHTQSKQRSLFCAFQLLLQQKQ